MRMACGGQDTPWTINMVTIAFSFVDLKSRREKKERTMNMIDGELRRLLGYHGPFSGTTWKSIRVMHDHSTSNSLARLTYLLCLSVSLVRKRLVTRLIIVADRFAR